MNPLAITDYARTQAELERFWVFGILVAGKDADWAARKVGDLLADADALGLRPFEYFREAWADRRLHNVLVANRVGQYTRTERSPSASGQPGTSGPSAGR